MSLSTILIADDDRSIRTVLTQALGRAGYDVQTTGNAATLWRWISEGLGDLVITDVMMPDENGLDLLPKIKKIRPDLRIIVMSAQNTLLTAVKANQGGAFEYLPKPFDIKDLVNIVQRALMSPKATIPVHNDCSEEQLPLIGRSQPMQDIYRTLARIMNTDLTVMINGETGTGKELVARALHNYGKRRNGPFVAINMAAIPKELIESELFGHEKGAFTGAVQRTIGRFQQAQEGTLFLDEIGDMPLDVQTRLLRVLQEGEYTMVGGKTAIKSNVRIIAATHRDLQQLIRQGLFREDLYYRLNVVPIKLPPLRDRREDIPELVYHFVTLARNEGLPYKEIDSFAIDRLKTYSWPGNIRQLENFIRRLLVLYTEDVIDADLVDTQLAESEQMSEKNTSDNEGISVSIERHLRQYFDAHEDSLPSAGLYDRILREVERPLLMISLEATRGNQIRTAQLLGLNRNTLRKKIKDLDIPVIRGAKEE
jgi:two-component system nitrogen regulation response regulator GlnG